MHLRSYVQLKADDVGGVLSGLAAVNAYDARMTLVDPVRTSAGQISVEFSLLSFGKAEDFAGFTRKGGGVL